MQRGQAVGNSMGVERLIGLRNRKANMRYSLLTSTEESNINSGNDAVVGAKQVDSIHSSIVDPNILSTNTLIDCKRSPISAEILHQALHIAGFSTKISDCLDGTKPFAKVSLPLGHAEITFKRDTKKNLHIKIRRLTFLDELKNNPTVVEYDADFVKHVIKTIASLVYRSRDINYSKEGFSSEEDIVS